MDNTKHYVWAVVAILYMIAAYELIAKVIE